MTQRTIVKGNFYIVWELNCWPGSNSAVSKSLNVLSSWSGINKLGADVYGDIPGMAYRALLSSWLARNVTASVWDLWDCQTQHKQPHIFTNCTALRVKTIKIYLYSVSTSVLNVVGYYNFSNGTNPKTSCILLPNICLSASVTTRNSIGFQRYRYEWIMCPLFIIYSFISYFLAKWSWLTVNCWSPRGRQNVCVRSRLLTWIVREKQQVLSSRQRLVC